MGRSGIYYKMYSCIRLSTTFWWYIPLCMGWSFDFWSYSPFKLYTGAAFGGLPWTAVDWIVWESQFTTILYGIPSFKPSRILCVRSSWSWSNDDFEYLAADEKPWWRFGCLTMAPIFISGTTCQAIPEMAEYPVIAQPLPRLRKCRFGYLYPPGEPRWW